MMKIIRVVARRGGCMEAIFDISMLDQDASFHDVLDAYGS
jgi:hypothetical protein